MDTHDHVWVVDDEPVNRILVRAVLEREGIKVREFEDAGQVMTALETERPSVLVIDIWMPGLKGDQLARWIRQQDHLASVRCVAYTAHGNPADILPLKRAGFDAVLLKPVTARQVMHAVNGEQP